MSRVDQRQSELLRRWRLILGPHVKLLFYMQE